MEIGNGNSNSGGVGGANHGISRDDVISKLKDDGDFDRLRLKIIRKLKENEDLRNTIVSIVKQSVALNRPGAENMKPRQLSDAIHQEVGEKLNEQISDELWEIIRSPDGMKSEITETVKSVYDKLSRPKRPENIEPSGHDPKRARNGHDISITGEVDVISDTEPKEPPGFSQTVSHQIDIINPLAVHNLSTEEQQKDKIHQSTEVLKNDKEQDDGSDEDLDAPPGFG